MGATISSGQISYNSYAELVGTLFTLFVDNASVKNMFTSIGFPSALIIDVSELCPNNDTDYIYKSPPDSNGHYFSVRFNRSSGGTTYYFVYNKSGTQVLSSPFSTSTDFYLGKGIFPSYSSAINTLTYYMDSEFLRPSNVWIKFTQFSTYESTFTDFYEGIETASSDPYDPAGTSDTGGGTGDLDGTSDTIDIPSLPALSAVDTGFISLFNPTLSQLNALASYMWSSLFDVATFKKLVNDPMSCILGLSIVPVNVPSGSAREITVGNIVTTVSMNVATSQYVSVDCGTLNVNEYWGAYLDYAPHTKVSIYLPYCGTHDLDIDDVMGKAVHVVYHVDILTGGCVAFVKCGSSVLYSFTGTCATQVPISNNDFSNTIKSLVDIGVAVGGTLATGGMTAPLTAGTVGGALGQGAEMFAGSTINGGMKPNVQKSGSMGSSIGLLGIQKPYLMLTRPRQCVPKYQNEFTGYPAYITRTLSDVSGYTEIYNIHLDGISATESELNEIDSLLKSGVIL